MMLVEELQAISGDWRAWVVVGLLALVALRSVVGLVQSSRGVANIQSSVSPEQARAYVTARHVSAPRFAIAMLAGFVASVTGLIMLSYGIKPAIALLLLAAGLFVIQTEPTRLTVRQSEYRVIAAAQQDEEAVTRATERLCSDQFKLVIINVSLVAAFAAGLLAF